MKQNKITYAIYVLLCVAGIGSGYYFYSTDTEVTTQANPSPTMSFFITSKNPGSGANLGGLAGADMYCKSLAENAGIYNKEWRAYLSQSANNTMQAINARDRIGNGPWYNFKGELIAKDLNELHTQTTLTKTTALTEEGEIISGRGDEVNIHDILTGSDSNGMLVSTSTDTTCNNWTSSDKGSAYVGHHDRIGINDSAPMKSWNSSHLTRGCSAENLKSTGGAGLFYCFAKN